MILYYILILNDSYLRKMFLNKYDKFKEIIKWNKFNIFLGKIYWISDS